ncbi:MAG: CapA family protein [Armatimonadota bacterium]
MRFLRHGELSRRPRTFLTVVCCLLWVAPAWARPLLVNQGSEAASPITISFVGDMLLASGVGRVAAARGSAHLFAGVRDLLRADDLTIGNLECAVATGGQPAEKQYVFRAHPSVLPGMVQSGVDAVSLANNHTLDYGRSALLETLEHLRKARLPAAGAGKDLESAYLPVLLSRKGQRIAFFAASRVLPSTSWYAGSQRAGIAQAYNPARLLSGLRTARSRADIVIVYLHWGKERAVTPDLQQRALARQCIDAGADLVIGSHPHVLQGFEYYRGKLIAYSLGNFVFTNARNNTAILQTTFVNGVLQNAVAIPCEIRQYRPFPHRDPDGRQVLQALSARSFHATVADDGTVAAAK